MVGHSSLEEQVDADFARARRRAVLRRVVPDCEETLLRIGCGASTISQSSLGQQLGGSIVV
jgi:hypothetical protein